MSIAKVDLSKPQGIHGRVCQIEYLQIQTDCSRRGNLPAAQSQIFLLMRPSILQIAFVSTTAEGYKQTRQWVNYHRTIGVTHFYLFVDGVAARPEV